MPRIAIVGAGFGGLGLAIQLKQHGIDTFEVFEKADEIGGTWRANTYPGAECDIPSALYSFSFENFDWPNKWSHQPVIKAYLEHCADAYALRPHIHLRTAATAAIWDEHDGRWTVTTETTGPDGSTTTTTEAYDVVVSATGQLSRPRWPDIDGLHDFGGDLFHSAEWDHDVDLTDRRVGSIGCGASAIQYVPKVAERAERTVVFQRTPNWVLPKNDRDYSEAEKALIRRSRIARNLRRFGLWFRADFLLFSLMRKRSRVRPLLEALSRKHLEDTVSDPVTRERLLPDYPMGAKRTLFSDDFYEAIEAHDVAIETDPIARVDASGVVTRSSDGTETHHDLDVLVVGTGFHTQDFLTPMHVEGRGGRVLEEEWADGPEAFYGISVHGYPNLFFLYGPNTNLGHNSIVVMIESQCRYLLSLLTQMAARSIQSVEVTADAQAAYNAELAERLADSAWVLIEDSWYLQGGKVTNNWVGRTWEYRRRTERADLDDYACRTRRLPVPGRAAVPATTG